VSAAALKYLPSFKSLATVLALCPGFASASTLLEFDTLEAGLKGRAAVAVQDGRMRIDQGPAWMVYDSGKNTVSVVEPQRRSYFQLTRDEMRRYGQQIGAARKLMDEHLQGMLPEQRAAMEKMLGGSTRRSPLMFQSTGKRREVAGYPCTGGRLVRPANRKAMVQEEVCLAAPQDIAMPEADYATVRALYRLMHEMQELGAPGILPDFSEIDGVPIEIRNPGGDFQRLTRAAREKLPDGHFTVPADYAREDILQALQRYKDH
jgi:hypothetical protein